MIHWYDVSRVLMIVFLVLTLIYVGKHFFPKTAGNPADTELQWADIRHELLPYLPGNFAPSGCNYTYMSPEGHVMCMLQTPHMTLAVMTKFGVITSVTASIKGYVLIGSMAMVEGAFERVDDGRSFKWGNLTAHTFTKKTPSKMFKAISMVSYTSE